MTIMMMYDLVHAKNSFEVNPQVKAVYVYAHVFLLHMHTWKGVFLVGGSVPDTLILIRPVEKEFIL